VEVSRTEDRVPIWSKRGNDGTCKGDRLLEFGNGGVKGECVV